LLSGTLRQGVSVNKRLPLGTVLKQPLVEFYYNDQLGDPLLTRDRLLLQPATPEQVEQIQQPHCKLINISQIFPQLRHYPGRLQTGIYSEAQLRLADELAPTPAVLEPV